MHKVSIKYVYLHRNKICPIKKQEKNKKILWNICF